MWIGHVSKSEHFLPTLRLLELWKTTFRTSWPDSKGQTQFYWNTSKVNRIWTFPVETPALLILFFLFVWFSTRVVKSIHLVRTVNKMDTLDGTKVSHVCAPHISVSCNVVRLVFASIDLTCPPSYAFLNSREGWRCGACDTQNKTKQNKALEPCSALLSPPIVLNVFWRNWYLCLQFPISSRVEFISISCRCCVKNRQIECTLSLPACFFFTNIKTLTNRKIQEKYSTKKNLSTPPCFKKWGGGEG